MIIDAEQGRGPNGRMFAGKRKTHWLLVIFSILALLVGQTGAIILGRYYFNNGGDNRWISTLVKSA